jgi:hypothetical protein
MDKSPKNAIWTILIINDLRKLFFANLNFFTLSVLSYLLQRHG